MATLIQSKSDFVNFTPTSDLGSYIRVLFRKIGLFHVFQHDHKLITVDIPFQIKSTTNGRGFAILVNKACLPRKYPLNNLLASSEVLEKKLGMNVDVQMKDEWIIFCLDSRGMAKSLNNS